MYVGVRGVGNRGCMCGSEKRQSVWMSTKVITPKRLVIPVYLRNSLVRPSPMRGRIPNQFVFPSESGCVCARTGNLMRVAAAPTAATKCPWPQYDLKKTMKVGAGGSHLKIKLTVLM
jgi:hypothetical protein